MARFSWDERKNHANRRKHGVSFEAATRVFRDRFVIFEQDREVEGEARWQAIGRASPISNEALLLLVAHTYEQDENEERIRIISARKATPGEAEAYHAQFYPGR
jgi:uncharacterized DUF497 family protein